MKQCGQCGAGNLDVNAVCTGCGQPLSLAAAERAPGGTLVLDAPRTSGAAKPVNLKGTMIGMAPSASAAQPPAPPPESPAAAEATRRAFSGTMLGMAPPDPTAPAATTSPEASLPGGGARLASSQKTVLGVARPGIAPLNPGQLKPAPAPAAPSSFTVPPEPAVPATAPLDAIARPKSRISATAALSIVGSAMLLAMAVVAFFMLRGHGSVTARASLDAKGNEQLELSCSECPDGTKTWIDAAPATFQAGRAILRLQAPLKVGPNPLVIVLERPGRSREEIALSIPIEYRVRGSTDELAQDPPKVAVVAVALPGIKLEIDGKPASADAAGVTRLDYDVTADVTGPAASVTSLERVAHYKAVTESGTQSGAVEIRIGVTPLVVDAPTGPITVGDPRVVIAGRTAPGSILEIGGRPVPLDPEGRFVSRQSLNPGNNTFVVRSSLKDHAPRLVEVAVRRSDDLQRELTAARARANASFADVVRAGEAGVGRSVALDGQLFDLRHDGYSSVLLVDAKGGCNKAPCLAKVVYGVETRLEKGRRLTAFGKVVRLVDGPRTGQRIPELLAELVVPGAP
jgi:hypothetical protein